MDDSKQIHIPNHPIQESGLIALKAALGLIPVAGGSVAQALGDSITLVQHQRETAILERVINELYRRIDQLPETIGESEALKTAILRAMRTAAETHDEEILDALGNAVVNIAIGEGPDDSLQIMFLDAMRGMTHWHIWLLACIADPLAWAKVREYPLASPDNPPDPETMLEAFYRGQLPADDFQVQLLQDLYNRGLATNNIKPRTSPMLSGAEDIRPRISDMGRKFLAFVTAPRTPETTTQENQPAQAGFAAERSEVP